MTGGAAAQIAVLLSAREGFGPGGAGGVGLDVRDLAVYSRVRERIRVYGCPIERPFEGIAFTPLQPVATRILGHTLGAAEALRRHLGRGAAAIVEVQNRPKTFHYLSLMAPRLTLALRLVNDPMTLRYGSSLQARRRIRDKAAAVYAISNFVRERFLAGLDDPEGKVHTIHIGIRRTLDRPPEKEPLILFVGRIIEEKGILHLVQALEAVLPRHPTWRAAIIGADRAGASVRSSFEETVLARAEALAPQLRTHGFLPHDQVLEFFRRAAISVVPSVTEEALGRVAIEGLAHGCAVIGYARGGIPEVVGGRGLVVEEMTPRGLEAALEALITDGARRQHLQRRAWDDYPFDLDKSVDAYDTVRERLLATLNRR